MQPLDAGLGCLHAGFGLDHLRLRSIYGGLARQNLGTGGAECGLAALQGGQVIVEFLLGQGIASDQGLGTGVALLRRSQLGLTLVHNGFGGGFLADAQGNLGMGRAGGVLRLANLGLGLAQLGGEHLDVHLREYLSGGDEIAFVDVDLQQTAS